MDRIFILNYNNYYNRIRKRFDNYQDYLPFLLYQEDGKPGEFLVNFISADDINTTQKITWNGNIPDYLIRCDASTYEIKSRWFVIEAFKIRGGQYVLTLYRDTIADYYNEIITAPIFIEKGNLTLDNPLIFNDENFTVNQIKLNEILLKDKSNCPWIVGYYAADATDITGTVPANNLNNISYIQLETPINDWKYYQYQNSNYAQVGLNNVLYRFYADGHYTDISKDGVYSGNGPVAASASPLYAKNPTYTYTILPGEVESRKEELYNAVPDYVPNFETDELLTYQDKLVRDSDGKVFRVSINSMGNLPKAQFIQDRTLFSLLAECAEPVFNGTPNTASFALLYYANNYIISLSEQKDLETSYNITQSGRLITEDAPWNIFAIPYGSINVRDSEDDIIVKTTKEIAIQTAMGVQKQHQSKVFDIQLLPYCPVQDLISDDNELTVSNTAQYSLITSPDGEGGNINVGIIFNLPRSRFDFNIFTSIPSGTTSIEKKLNNQCDKWRLASPNYSNYFDFSVEKNNGIDLFNVDCEYKPFTPYIHINPNFKNLYGDDWNDVRGLILGGDFSLSQIIDQWEQYQIQNKNFQNIFDRQIQNMEINQQYSRISEGVGLLTGTIQGGASGAATGAYASGGSPMGAIIGAGIGAVVSAAGGIADLSINEALRQETLDYTKDQFGYQLGNIQALPQTISKVSSLNNNNKLFPVLEFYSCKFVEKKAFLNKIAFNGMTIMAIGTIDEIKNNTWSYTISDENGDNTTTITSKNYIKGKLIRLENIPEDFHVINDIAKELDKGVYL